MRAITTLTESRSILASPLLTARFPVSCSPGQTRRWSWVITTSFFEHDCGEETVALGTIIRDATIARKHLVYDQLERIGTLDDLGWGKRLYLYVIDSTRQNRTSSRKRLKRCLETLPAQVNPRRMFFVDRQSFMEAGDDIKNLVWVRGDPPADSDRKRAALELLIC
jgi:hypothetical protein